MSPRWFRPQLDWDSPACTPSPTSQPAATVPDEVRASAATASTLRSTIDEYVQANASTEQAAALGDFAAKPLIVLTAGSGHDAAWAAAQNRMATLSTNSVHRIIDGATHEDVITDEEDAAATTQAILDVVASVRSKAPWSGDPGPQQSAWARHLGLSSAVLTMRVRDLRLVVAGQSAISSAMAPGRGSGCGTRTEWWTAAGMTPVQATVDSTRPIYRRGLVRSAE